jgi:hypothetical protein
LARKATNTDALNDKVAPKPRFILGFELGKWQLRPRWDLNLRQVEMSLEIRLYMTVFFQAIEWSNWLIKTDRRRLYDKSYICTLSISDYEL